jgi:FkbH-like protein
MFHPEAGSPLAEIRDRLADPALTAAGVLTGGSSIAQHVARLAAAGEEVQRVALLGDTTPGMIEAAISGALLLENELAQVFSASYGVETQQLLDAASAFRQFSPDTVVLLPDSRIRLREENPAEGILRVWDELERQGCRIFQHLLVPPAMSLRGIADRRDPSSPVRRVAALNETLLKQGEGRVTFIEMDRLAERCGVAAWLAPRYFQSGRLPFDPRFLPQYLQYFRAAWRQARGRVKKLLVLDMDDTLWGGVIGEEGVEGICLGPDSGARGEAFADWQAYLADLSRRGVILAICSKNEPEAGLSGLRHQHSVLSADMFAAMSFGWEDKASRIRGLAEQLNLGTDALVFVDDNPAERDLVRRLLPEVTVVDIGTDPSRFIERLEEGHWFDLDRLTAEDQARTAAYAARTVIEAGRLAATDLAAYLDSLEMTGSLVAAAAADLPRMAQMEGKINQFNLTTRRFTRRDLADFMADPARQVLVFRLKDRFADHGLVGLMIVATEGDSLRIDSWLLSCRVFSRTAEEFMLAHLLDRAETLGLAEIVGLYSQTARNAVVENLYPRLGFRSDGAGRWVLPVTPQRPPSAIRTAS